jgi:uncharacterized RDD family membrane protein YckC
MIIEYVDLMGFAKRLSPAYGSFSRRALARFIDLSVVLAACGVIYLVNQAFGFPVRYTSLFNWQWPESATMFMTYDFGGLFIVFISIKLFLAFPYFALMESSRWQGTLGKLALGIKVTDLNGERISFGRAIGRYFLKGVSAFLLMLGYLISFSDQRQTWHDYTAGTLVLGKNVFPQYYAMPKISSRWMFDVPFISRRQDNGIPMSAYQCIFCDYHGEKHVGCPSCGRVGYAPATAISALLMMNGIIFTLIGGWLGYVTWWTVNERLLDDRLQREGTPWGIIFLIFAGCALCLSGGLSAILGKKWPIRLMIAAALLLGGRSKNTSS